MRFDIGNGFFNGLGIGHVKYRSMGGGAFVAELHHRIVRSRGRKVINNDFCAILRQTLSHDKTDPLSCARN
ncbi:Uncharacterised protein [Klebsiella pneumoniae]|nr:Uncharacterised protein [Klebsiella pneumoniae]